MKSILVVMSRFNMLIYMKYESGEGIILGMIKKDNVSKKRWQRNIVLKFLRGNCQLYDDYGIVVTVPMRLSPLITGTVTVSSSYIY